MEIYKIIETVFDYIIEKNSIEEIWNKVYHEQME